jgi:uncharacterized protein YoxC
MDVIKQEKRILHYRYWLCILVFILIEVIALQYGDQQYISEKLNFGLTLVSAVLAVFAIYLTVTFNGQFSKNVSDLNSINDGIKEASKVLLSSTEQLKNNVNVIPDAIKSINEKVELTHLLLEKNINVPKSVTNKEEIKWNNDSITLFFTTGPKIHMAYVYLLATTYHKGIELKKSVLIEKTPSINFDFLLGYMCALSAVNIIDFVYIEETLKITYFNKNLLDIYETLYESVINVVKDNSTLVLIKNEVDRLVSL